MGAIRASQKRSRDAVGWHVSATTGRCEVSCVVSLQLLDDVRKDSE